MCLNTIIFFHRPARFNKNTAFNNLVKITIKKVAERRENMLWFRAPEIQPNCKSIHIRLQILYPYIFTNLFLIIFYHKTNYNTNIFDYDRLYFYANIPIFFYSQLFFFNTEYCPQQTSNPIC